MTTYVITTRGGRQVTVTASSPDEAKQRARKILQDESAGTANPSLPTLGPAESRGRTIVGIPARTPIATARTPSLPTLGPAESRGRTIVGIPARTPTVTGTGKVVPATHQRFRNLGQRLADKGAEFQMRNFVWFCDRASHFSFEAELARDRILYLEQRLSRADQRAAELEQSLLNSAPESRIAELEDRIAELEELLQEARARSSMAAMDLTAVDLDAFGEETKTTSNPLPEQARRTSAIKAPSIGGES